MLYLHGERSATLPVYMHGSYFPRGRTFRENYLAEMSSIIRCLYLQARSQHTADCVQRFGRESRSRLEAEDVYLGEVKCRDSGNEANYSLRLL